MSSQDALNAGGVAAAVRALAPNGGKELEGLLVAYSNAVDHVFYLLAAIGVVGFVFSWGIGWKDVRGKKKETGLEAGGGEVDDEKK